MSKKSKRLYVAIGLAAVSALLASCSEAGSTGNSGNPGGSAGALGSAGAISGSAGAISGSAGAISGNGGATSGGASSSGGTSGSGPCALGQAQCGGVCVTLSNNTSNCGTCANVCAAGQTCTASTCQCLPGLAACNGACIDSSSDPANCGACGLACASGQVCSAGTCKTACDAGLTQCGASCVDLQTSITSCGTCNQACPSGQSCSASACVCPGTEMRCNEVCTDTQADPGNCGSCGNQCQSGATCSQGSCSGGTGGAGAGGTSTGGAGAGGASAGGGGGSSGGTGGTSAGSGGVSGSGGTGSTGECDPGTTTTQWASSCATSAPTTCVSGTWTAWGSSSPENYPFRYETAHFAFYWPDGRNVTMQQAQAAGDFLENTIWRTYMGAPMFFPEPYCNTSAKKKVSIHIIENGLYGGCNVGPGMWIGPGALQDHWGLGHEFAHSIQCLTPAFPDCGGAGCWIHESHANWMSHQLPEYRGETHCSDMLVDAPHVYYGSSRDRYCNWQLMEFLKDKHCHAAVNALWGASNVPNGQRDPLGKLAFTRGWNAEQLNDFFGDWAMHNITWDYRSPDGSTQGAAYRAEYGAVTSKSANQRRHRLTQLEAIDDQWAQNQRFVSPSLQAPQRLGYNVVRLYPAAGSSSVTVKFRGVTQSGASSGWRWGLVATDQNITTPRYSPLQAGADGELEFCVSPNEALWLVVVGAPTVIQKIVWDQAYASIYRYPYMVELQGAWPEGFQNGQRDACAAGERHENGGGCAPANLAASVYVGPYAQVLGGNVSGSARIEGHAVVTNGTTVSGGTVTGLSILTNGFNVSGSARVETSFFPVGFFEPTQGLSGSARLFGDVEYRGPGLNRSSGSFSGFVDSASASQTISDVTIAPPYAWRP